MFDIFRQMSDSAPRPEPAHDFEIIRHLQTTFATYGRMYDAGGKFVCVTLERPWVDADHNGKRDTGVSRFAPGLFSMFLRKSKLNGGDGKRSYDVWQFVDAPDVVAAQVHIANLPDELEGCVATGEEFADVKREKDPKALPGISGSKTAFDRFMALTKGKTKLFVKVTDAFPKL